MRRLTLAILVLCAALLYFAPGSRALMSGVAYTDFANIFTSNQRINAGLGVNVAPGATGTISASAGLFDQSRTTAIGEWTDVAFASGNFTASGSMTWTVQSADQITFEYMLIGHTMFLSVYLDSTTVGGTASNQLFIKIPGGFSAAKKVQGMSLGFDNGTAVSTFTRVSAGGTTVEVGKSDVSNFALSTNNTFIRVIMAFEVS